MGLGQVGAEHPVGVDLGAVGPDGGDPVEADAAGREPHEVSSQTSPLAWCSAGSGPRGRSRTRRWRARPGRARRVVDDPALREDPPRADQPDPVLALADHDPAARARVGRHRAAVAAPGGVGVQPVPGAGVQPAALRQPVAGLEAEHRRAGVGPITPSTGPASQPSGLRRRWARSAHAVPEVPAAGAGERQHQRDHGDERRQQGQQPWSGRGIVQCIPPFCSRRRPRARGSRTTRSRGRGGSYRPGEVTAHATCGCAGVHAQMAVISRHRVT